MNESYLIAINDQSGMAEARRIALKQADAIGMKETEKGNLAIIVTEAASNMLKHANGGQLILRKLREGEKEGIEVLALDKGPGMTDITRSLRDGHSTAGSPGTGLGAMQRLSSLFDIFSLPGRGTAVLATLWHGSALPAPQFTIGGVSLPLMGEDVCGDAWASRFSDNVLQIMVVDGLGHGRAAHDASLAALASFSQHPNLSPADTIGAIHLGLRGTRGAAVAVTSIASDLRYCGVGNIAGVITGAGNNQHLVSHNGTLGEQLRKVQEFEYEFAHDSVAILSTDGLVSSWNIEGYPGLSRKHPSIIAGVLYRDFARGRDDVTVVVATRR